MERSAPHNSTTLRLRRRAAALTATALAAPVLTLATTAPAGAVGPCNVGLMSGDNTRLGNLVFSDLDGDGSFEPADGDAGLAGVTVDLWHDVDGDGVFEPGGDDGAAPVCSTVTDASGSYWFSQVSSATWFVAVGGVADGLESSDGASLDAVTDNDDNGLDPAPAGYDAVSGPIVVEIMENQPRDEAAPGAPAGSDEDAANAAEGFSPDDDSNLTIDFGFTAPVAPVCVSIGNRVWLDADTDGLADDGLGGTDALEPGIDGVSIELRSIAADGSATTIAATTTADGGYYFFDCVAEGDYQIAVPASNFAAGAPLDGLRSSVDRAERAEADRTDDGEGRGDGTDGDVVSRTVTLTAATAPTDEADKPSVAFDQPSDADADTTVDFGFSPIPTEPPVPPQPPVSDDAALGDRVWSDLDGDGIQDAGEPGVSGVRIALVDADGNQLDETVTDGDGIYGFDELPAGTYGVCVLTDTLPTGTTLTVADAGDDAADSDIAPGEECTPLTDLAEGEEDLTLDIGIVPTVVEPPADHDVAITKSGVRSGISEVAWTITASNVSAADSGPFQITDHLAAGTQAVSVEVTGDAVCAVVVDEAGAQTVECHGENLAPGASVTVILRATKPAGNVCSVANTATVDTAGIAFDDGSSAGAVTIDTDAANDTATATVTLPCNQLPVTGSSTGPMTGMALGLAGAGGALVLWVRRERPISIADRLG